MKSFNQLTSQIRSLLKNEYSTLKKTIKIKTKNEKDLVTKLDIKIQKLIFNFYKNSNYNLISEENFHSNHYKIFKEKMIIIDPLDGTINFKLGLPFFCSQWAILEKFKLKSAIYISSDEIRTCLLNKKVPKSKYVKKISKPIYLALGSDSNIKLKKLSMNAIQIIEENSPGFYRWGSAGFALSALSNNKLGGFVGINCMFWDIIPILPFLIKKDFPIYYKWVDEKISICVSYNKNFNKKINKLFADNKIKLIKIQKNLKLVHEKL